jgi:hypothetical protein
MEPDRKTIAVIHFVGRSKPWSWNIAGKVYQVLRLVVRGQFSGARILLNYFRLIRLAHEILQ